MIISRTPYRMSFFGGGTDYPDWYRKHAGAVLSTSIDKYCYLMCRYLPPFFGIKHRVVWSHIETVASISEILHPAVREGLRYLGFDDSVGIEIHHQGDLPARSGIGSSSSFSVGLINALLALRSESVGKHDLALKAMELEQNILKEGGGSQDQVAAAYGGLNLINFLQDGIITVQALEAPQGRIRELEAHLMLVYLGTSRMSSDITTTLTANLRHRATALKRMHQMVYEGARILQSKRPLEAFGELLHEGWMLKRSLAESVTNSQVDTVYEAARAHGAIGGKLMGAGGSGFMMLFVPPRRQPEVQQALANYLWVPFSFESTGSTIIYRDPGLTGWGAPALVATGHST